MTTPTPYADSASSSGSAPIPPVGSNVEREDQSQDPTWEPRRQPEIQTTASGTQGKNPGLRIGCYADTQATPDYPSTEVIEEQNDIEVAGTEPLTNPTGEVYQIWENGDAPLPRYNLRSLPGRRS